IRTGGIDKLMNAYNKCISSHKLCLTDGKTIYWNNVRKLVSELASLEEEYIIKEHRMRNNKEKQFLPEETPEEFILVNALLKACTSVTEHILELADRVLDPLGMNLGDLADTANIADKQQVKLDTYAVMQSQFDGTEGAFAYLLFILLYTPCVAATAAIYRETSPGWAAFTVCWTTGIAYLTATAYYQFTQLAIHPLASFSWLIGSFVLVVVLIAMLHYYGRRKLVL
ncbi:MAG: hypothetical protein EBR59_01200, partial [Methylococcaceae bacterium]|nr:hypothetical protein [Methylococcaceae bacterium]